MRDRVLDIRWGERRDLALVMSMDMIKHWTQLHAADFDGPNAAARLIWDMSSDEAYHHPGYPVMKTLPNGVSVVCQDGDAIYLDGEGALPEGDRGFLDRMDLKTLEKERLFRCDRSSFEWFAGWLDSKAGKFLTRRESPRDPPNFFVRTLAGRIAAEPGERSAPAHSRPSRICPTPRRSYAPSRSDWSPTSCADGLDLSFMLYLPPGFKAGTRLPAIVWAYPLDYSDAKMAGQVTGSTQTFVNFARLQHLFPLLEGYAVIDNPLMPVVGDSDKIYDTYMDQLVAGAQAAVDKAVELGVVDRDRIGIAGHSHGGLMTANLLAHSDLFRAGAAQRSLQPVPDRVRLSERAPHSLAGARGLRQGLDSVPRGQDQRAAPAHPRRARRQPRYRAPSVGEALRGHPGQRRHGAPGHAAFRIPRLPRSSPRSTSFTRRSRGSTSTSRTLRRAMHVSQPSRTSGLRERVDNASRRATSQWA